MDDVEVATVQWDCHDPRMVLCREKIEYMPTSRYPPNVIPN